MQYCAISRSSAAAPIATEQTVAIKIHRHEAYGFELTNSEGKASEFEYHNVHALHSSVQMCVDFIANVYGRARVDVK